MSGLSELIKTSKLESIDAYMFELKRYKMIFEDESNFREFLFEYGCQMAEYIQVNPVTQSGYVKHIIKEKLHEFYMIAQQVYWCYPKKNARIPKIKLELIPDVVRGEHNVGSVSAEELMRRNREE